MADKLTLLPCWHCNHEAEICETPEFVAWVECPSCCASGPLADDPAAAIAAWNRRVPSPALTAAREALEPFANMTCSVQRRVFLQLLLCPEGDDDPKDFAKDIRRARAALALLKEQTHD